ncbi:MAG: sensor histidine kinase [Chitinophagaceae bacterium]
MFKRISNYWRCQIIGWAFYGLMPLFFAYSFHKLDWKFAGRIGILFIIGILVTHTFRWLIITMDWLRLPFEKLIWRFLISIMVGGGICMGLTVLTDFLLHLNEPQKSLLGYLAGTLINETSLIFFWGLIYFFWHYVENNRNNQLDKLKLESVVKELELKTIKAQLNPHFIFNALNSIRALIDENPQRARRAITELSNIMRSSMQAEKAEMVSLENEINIVRDYLALENIRFEERLRVELDIDPDTLALPVPPMMLQTLVENCIKHGISKEVKGGVVNIISRIQNQQHEILIQNTGRITGEHNSLGFGLQSTRQRLSLLFGTAASFEIYNKDQHLVEAKIKLPLL